MGRNLCLELKNIRDGKARCWGDVTIDEVYEYDIDSTPEELEIACKNADFVFNLAGVNRPQNTEEFMQGNFGFASTLLDTLKKYGNKCPVMISSSIQAALDNPYGESKRAGEQLMFAYSKETGAKVLVYRFPNLFGKWCRPNYNSAVATFCNNKANDLPIQVNNPATELTLVYIDDLVAEMIAALKGEEHREGEFCKVPVEHKATLGEIVGLLDSFKAMPSTLMIPEIPAGSFAKKLYSTYLSYLPKDKAIFDLKMNCDDRGSFTELVHTPKCGQVSINISKPGITKGQHWHHTKWEQFIVVKGHGLIQMRSLSPALPTREGVRPYDSADPTLYAVLKEKAKEMRKNPTTAEMAMWELLRANNVDAKFRRQHIIGDYIVDFVDLATGLVVEVDGGYHTEQEQRELDAQRTGFLQRHGYTVIRFTNDEVIGNASGVVTIIRNALRYLTSLPCGEGRGEAVLNFFVSGDKIQSVIMLPGYTHNIINLSDTEDLVTVMYCNEIFDPSKPDTYGDPVVK